MTQLEESPVGRWVWKYYFNKKLSSNLSNLESISADMCLRLPEELVEKINDDPVTYSTYGIFIDKSIKNTILFKYKKKDVYDVYKLIIHYLLHLENGVLIIEGVDFRIHDTIEFYRLIKSKNKLKIILNDDDYLYVKYLKIWLEEPLE